MRDITLIQFVIWIIFISVGIIIVISFIGVDFIELISIVFLIVTSVIVYKICRKKQIKRHVTGFWKNDWYEKKCDYITIIYALTGIVIVQYFIDMVSS